MSFHGPNRRLRATHHAPRVEELESRVLPANHLFTVPGDAGQQTQLEFDWTVRSADFNNEVGVYVVEDSSGRVSGLLPSDPGYLDAALQNAQVLFRSGQGAGARNELTFDAGDQLAFYLAQDDSADDVRADNPQNQGGAGELIFFSVDGINPDQFDHVRERALGDGSMEFAWEDLAGGGDQDFNDVIFTVGSLGAQAVPVPGQTGETVSTTFSVASRDAAFKNEVGVFVTDDARGTVAGLSPGDSGYANAALASASSRVLFTADQGAGATTTVDLPGGGFLGLYMVVNGTTEQALARDPAAGSTATPQVFFAFTAANPDGLDHLRWFSETTFGFEDLLGGGDQDFNDVVVEIRFSTTDQPPDTTGPTEPTFSLDPAFDTGTQGDDQTTLGTIALVGQTDPNTPVTLNETGASTTSDESGAFTFTDVPLAVGSNTFTVVATGPTGDTSQSQRIITRPSPPTVRTPISAVALAPGDSETLDLAANFDDPDISNTFVRLDTSAGPINVELFDRQAPQTVTNFLNYVTDNDYADSIFHRLATLPGGVPFVLQGGGFSFRTGPARLENIPTDPAVQNEPDPVNRSNLRGTVAMAKLGGDPNSATNQFFFNLGDNSANLDNQNGGFTVFGRVASAADQQVVDALAAIPTQDQSQAPALPPSQQGVFSDIPLQNYAGTNFPTDTVRENYALANGLSVVRRTEELTYSVVSNSNPAAVTATVTRNRLTLTANQNGPAAITVRATDQSGSFVDLTFNVNVG
ncbi:MAG: peptidylprolyl isomerase [Gemmataceae bacterium]|nr:peptidylprolyl isomerase [Gemmataceae bacterium]